ncbi:MAG: PQQ-binding-like beta-propeller repeat protein, partial [Myxococcota bacterium]
DAATGEQRWQFTTGGRVEATPIVWYDGERTWVYVASRDRQVYALDAEVGRQQWTQSVVAFRPTLTEADLPSPCVGRVGDIAALFVPYWVADRSLPASQQEAGVLALEATTGRRLWSVSLGDNRLTAVLCAQAVGRPQVFVGSANGNLYALAADDGRILWQRTELDAVRGVPSLIVGAGGPRVVFSSKSGVVRSVDAESGAQQWSYRAGDWVIGSVVGTRVAGREAVLIGSYDHSLHALDLTTGRSLWRSDVGGAIYSAPALLAGDDGPVAVVAAWDHFLYGIDVSSGARRWRRFAGRPQWDVVGLEHSDWASPVTARIGGTWMVYHGSYDGVLRGWPLALLAGGASDDRRTNTRFWLSFPLVLVGVGGLALALTRRHRRAHDASTADDE